MTRLLHLFKGHLVRLIYYYGLADFKLQESKEQSREFSCAVMENFDA